MRAVGLGRVVLLAVALSAAPRVLAVSLFAVPDVPADLDGATRLPWDIVRKDTPGSWSLATSLPFPTAVDGLHRMDSGDWSSWYSHTALDCSDDGAPLTETVPAGSGNLYYLVVPENTDDEGSYGLSSASSQRPRGIMTCTLTQTISSCP